jgi:hypothetical protein
MKNATQRMSRNRVVPGRDSGPAHVLAPMKYGEGYRGAIYEPEEQAAVRIDLKVRVLCVHGVNGLVRSSLPLIW